MTQAAAISTERALRSTWPRPPSAPGWFSWVPQASAVWALGYGTARVWWAIHGTPSFGPPGFDLLLFTGWSAVALCAFTAIAAIALRSIRWCLPLFVAGLAICAAHLLACPLLLLDLTGIFLPGIGVHFSALAFLSRSACLIEGLLIGATAVAYRRRWRSTCLFCGRAGTPVLLSETPGWAWFAAYAAVVGCLIRLGAQDAVGFGWLHRYWSETHVIVQASAFEAAFLLAGIVLPLSLVHTWGRILPQWIPFLRGRRVPRWLPLAPAFVISTLMVVYFGLTLAKIAAITLSGESRESLGPFPLAFFWVAVPGYLIWGIGLGIAAISYYRITYPECRVCHF